MSLEILCSDSRLSGCTSFAAIGLSSPVVFCANPSRKLVSTFSNASGALKWQSDGAVQTVGPQTVFSDGTLIHAIGVGLWYSVNSSNVVQATAIPYNLTDPNWGIGVSSSVVAIPYGVSGVQTLNAATGAYRYVLPDITSRITLAVAGGGYIYCLNQDRATGTALTVDANGILALANNTRFLIPNGHIIRGALVDGTTLVVATDHRVLQFSLTDPTTPTLTSSTTLTQTIRGVGLIAPGRYWLATDETISAQNQVFALPTVAAMGVNGVLVSFSPAFGGAENTPTPFSFNGVASVPAGSVSAAPAISPPTGNYTGIQTVVVTAALGATIYYTVDGSTPTTGSLVYTGSFAVSATTTVRAAALEPGKSLSSPVSSTVTITLGANALTFNGRIDAAAALNGILYVGGQFTSVTDAGGAKTRTRLAAVDLSTGLVTAWNPTADASIRCLKFDPLGRLWCLGDFANCGGSARAFVARFDAVNIALDSFTSGMTGGSRATDIDFDTNLGGYYIVGSFTTVGGVAHQYFAAYTNTDSFRTTSPSLSTLALAWGVRYVPASGKVYVVGQQSTAAGVVLDSSTLALGTWPVSVTGGAAIAFGFEISGGIAYIAGTFSALQSTTRNGFGAVDLTTSATLQAFDPNASAQGENIGVDSNGVVYTVGDFTTIAATSRNYAAAFTPAGAIKTTWNAGLTGGSTCERIIFIGSTAILTGAFTNPSGGTNLYLTSIA